MKKLLDEPATLPSGGTLTARRFLQLGMALGGSPSSFASLHSLFQSAFLQPDETDFTRSFLKAVDNDQPFDDHPIYYLLHESIYADGLQSSPRSGSFLQYRHTQHACAEYLIRSAHSRINATSNCLLCVNIEAVGLINRERFSGS